MARPGITYEQVAAVADSLQAQGKRPTVEAIRAQLGTGSPNTIHRHLSAWKEARPTVAAAPVEMPAAIHAAIVEEIRRAASEARAVLEQELAEARATADDLAEAGEALEAERDTLADQLANERADNQQLVGQVDELHREIERVKVEAGEKVAEVKADAAVQINEAREQAQHEREAAETARQRLAEANVRLEAMPRLESDLERLRAELAAEREGREKAERAAAVAVARLEAEQQAHQLAEARAASAEKKEHQVRSELAERVSAHEKTRDALAECTALSAERGRQIEALTADLAHERNAGAAAAEAQQAATERAAHAEGLAEALQAQLKALQEPKAEKPASTAKRGGKGASDPTAG